MHLMNECAADELRAKILTHLAADEDVPPGAPQPYLPVELIPGARADACNWRLPPVMHPQYPHQEALARAVAAVQREWRVRTQWLGGSARPM